MTEEIKIPEVVLYWAKKLKKLEESFIPIIQDLRALSLQVKRGELSDEEACDLGYIFREMEDLYDQARKEHKARHNHISETLAKKKIMTTVGDPEAEDGDQVVEGFFCKGHPQLKHYPGLPNPKKDFTRYKLFYTFLGVPEKLIDAKVIKMRWHECQDFFTKLLEERDGKLPPGIDRTTPEFKTTFRKKRNQPDV